MVRIIRILEYIGPADQVEKIIKNSIRTYQVANTIITETEVSEAEEVNLPMPEFQTDYRSPGVWQE